MAQQEPFSNHIKVIFVQHGTCLMQNWDFNYDIRFKPRLATQAHLLNISNDHNYEKNKQVEVMKVTKLLDNIKINS